MTDIRRDRWGRYLVVPPDGGQPTGYTRVTTVAKALDDGGGLIPWKATMAMTGMMRRPGLRAAFEALIADSNGDPWYHSLDSKNKAKRLVEQCAEAGGSADRADIGTALHALTEALDRHLLDPDGRPTPIVSQATSRTDLEVYRSTLAAAGITFDPAGIEAMVVLDEHRVAGMADRLIAHVPEIGDVVADVKTGADLEYSWRAICVQLAAYAHADAIYQQGAAPDGSQDVRLPAPAISREVGLVIHLPAGEGRCSLHLVDLVAGWEAFGRSMWTRGWRTTKTLARRLEVTAQPAFPATEAPAPTPAPAVDDRRAQLLERYRGLCDEDQRRFRELGVDPADLDAVEAALDSVDPFLGSAPVPELPSWVQRMVEPAERVEAPRPDEGDLVGQAVVNELGNAINNLPDDQRELLNKVARESFNGPGTISLKALPSRRRYEIARALRDWLTVGWDEEIMRDLLGAVVESDVPRHPATPLGVVIGWLSIDEAVRFGDMARAVIGGAAVTHTGDRWTVQTAA